MENELTRETLDSQFEAVADVHRRRILVRLFESSTDTAVDIDQIVTAGEKLSFHHVHFPKLEEDGFIEVDMEWGEIYRGPQFSEIEPLLDVLLRNREKLPVPISDR